MDVMVGAVGYHDNSVGYLLCEKAFYSNKSEIMIVIGDPGEGKTSYALWLAKGLLGDWEKVKKVVVFKPMDFLKLLHKQHEISRRRGHMRLKVVIMDDAGTWLSALAWMEKGVRMFLRWIPLVRTSVAAMIFTTLFEELPKKITTIATHEVVVSRCGYTRNPNLPPELNIRTAYEKLPRIRRLCRKYGIKPLVSVARGYKVIITPRYRGAGFMKRLSLRFYDLFPTYYPKQVYDWYIKRRLDVSYEYVSIMESKLNEFIGGDGGEEVDALKIAMVSEASSLITSMPEDKLVRHLMKTYGVPEKVARGVVEEVKKSIKEFGKEVVEAMELIEDFLSNNKRK